MDNYQKYKTYRELKVRLKKALQSGFWFEATIIEYAIMEDRTRSILSHVGLHPSKLDGMSLYAKVKSLSNQIRINHPVLGKKMDEDLLERIQEWRVLRNKIVHEACYHPYDEEAVKKIAEEGSELVNQLINNSRRITNYYKKHQNESE